MSVVLNQDGRPPTDGHFGCVTEVRSKTPYRSEWSRYVSPPPVSGGPPVHTVDGSQISIEKRFPLKMLT